MTPMINPVICYISLIISLFDFISRRVQTFICTSEVDLAEALIPSMIFVTNYYP